MNIGLVWPANHRLTDITVRYERYARGFEGLGHSVVTVCPGETAAGYRHPVHTVPDVDALRYPELWRGLRLDVAVVIAWLRMPELLEALRAGSKRVVSIGESDGVVGVRQHPLTILRRMVAFHPRWRQKAGAAKHWVQLAAGGWRVAEREIVRSTDAADRVTMTSPRGRDNLAAVLSANARPDLSSKLAVVPYPVDEHYLAARPPQVNERADRVVAIGRWDDPQKDAGLLAAGFDLAAAHRPATEFVIVGRGGEGVFAGLVRRRPQVRYAGPLPGERLAELLRTSRALVLSSRWESGPIVAFEALASGATVVGPRWVPACEWFAAEGSGRTFDRRSGAELGRAVLGELAAWEGGERDPQATADRWRPRFDPIEVCRQLLAAEVERG